MARVRITDEENYFFDAADLAPERMVRRLASAYEKVKAKVDFFLKSTARAETKHFVNTLRSSTIDLIPTQL